MFLIFISFLPSANTRGRKEEKWISYDFSVNMSVSKIICHDPEWEVWNQLSPTDALTLCHFGPVSGFADRGLTWQLSLLSGERTLSVHHPLRFHGTHLRTICFTDINDSYRNLHIRSFWSVCLPTRTVNFLTTLWSSKNLRPVCLSSIHRIWRSCRCVNSVNTMRF